MFYNLLSFYYGCYSYVLEDLIVQAVEGFSFFFVMAWSQLCQFPSTSRVLSFCNTARFLLWAFGLSSILLAHVLAWSFPLSTHTHKSVFMFYYHLPCFVFSIISSTGKKASIIDINLSCICMEYNIVYVKEGD